jgi:hypothetical protein
MRIGITIALIKGRSIFSNGLTQNVLMFYDLVSKMPKTTSVSLLDMEKRNFEDYQEFPYLDGYDVVQWDNNTIQDDFDVIVIFGISPNVPLLKKFKEKPGNKIVAYKGGNNAVIQMESLIFSQRSKDLDKVTEPAPIIDTGKMVDEVWMVPQQEFHNLDIFSIQNYAKSKVVPFIWSPRFIEESISNIKKENPDLKIMFDEKKHSIEKWNVATTEPNTSVLKNMYPLIHIFEWAYRQNPDIFDKFRITNAAEFAKNEYLIKFIYEFEFYHGGKLKLAPRWSITKLLAEDADLIISHQWGNPLNYAYLDTVYLGYPLIHNAHLCQDIGYYYEGWNLKNAGDLVLKAINERPSDHRYTARHRKILSRYTLDNAEMINQYQDLFDNLWTNNMEDQKYNWKTNLLE